MPNNANELLLIFLLGEAMARNLKTGYMCIATSGSVVHGAEDGRVIEKEWLEQMAANYNTRVYTACIWPEHRRYFNFGTILALKAEPATDPELKGEVQLFAIIAPNNSLIAANAEGQYCFPSIEVGENYRGTGTYFLKGLGVTDEPASAGVTELKFSKAGKDQTVLVVPGHEFNVNEHLNADTKPNLMDRIFGKTNADTSPDEQPEPHPMAKDKANTPDEKTTEFSALVDAIAAKTAEQMDTKLADFAKAHGLVKPADDEKGGDGKEPETEKETGKEGGDYAKLQTELDDLKAEFAKLQNTPTGGTDVPEGEGGDGSQGRCL
ncbi:GPO family capsid scaffolding protein [Gilvimarinus japonicus]|uniref:GPO family capsid scaffolding protein n=1 Tax=Gilvimarinus japonicus TaxID=1796469 RepID=A0ABV7HT47_9GAMM